MTRPELMAIGDSVYNGVRSLTISRDLAAHAVPAQVARAFNWPFVTPDYPRPIIEDFEKGLFRHPLFGLLELTAHARANAEAWLAPGPWSAHARFDNLSIAQQTVTDVTRANAADALAMAQKLLAPGRKLALKDLNALYQALNTAFILNPSRAPGDSRNAVAILAEAQPRRIAINIGINDGLWNLVLMGDTKDYRTDIDPTAAMAGLAQALADHCDTTEHFYINLLPKPSALASLMPRKDDTTPVDSYFDHYLGRRLQAGEINRATMREVDEFVDTDLNPRIRQAFSALGNRAHFVDLYATTAAYDRKNGIATRCVKVHGHNGEMLLDNLPLEAIPGFGGLKQGGMFSLDNLHPTIPGYGVLAQAVCDVIAATEGGPAPIIDQQACYVADTMLQQLPGEIELSDFAFSFVGAFIPPHSADQA